MCGIGDLGGEGDNSSTGSTLLIQLQLTEQTSGICTYIKATEFNCILFFFMELTDVVPHEKQSNSVVSLYQY